VLKSEKLVLDCAWKRSPVLRLAVEQKLDELPEK